VISLAAGGTERLVLELVGRTRGRCVSLVCCLDEDGIWASDVRQQGVPVVSLDRQPGFRPGVGWRLAALARRHHAQVLHCHQYSAFVYGHIASVLTGASVVFTEHGRLSDHPPSAKRQLVNPVLGRLGVSMYAVSEHLRDHMAAEGLPCSRIGVIHNGIDPGPIPEAEARARARATLALPADALVVGTAARLEPVKDLETLLRAIQSLRAQTPDVRLVIFGDGPERAALEAQARSQGIAESVLFAGHRQDVRALLPALDIFVNCSVSEGISLTILEAMAAALPVVATAVGGTPEVVVPGVTGTLVPAREPGQLAAALSEIAESAPLRTRFGMEGRRRVIEDFHIDRMVDAYVAQYRRAAGKAF